MSTLTLGGLTVERGGRPVVKVVTITVPAGEVTAVLGPNGAGKSSMVLAVGGVLRPRPGSVSLDGTELAGRETPSSETPMHLAIYAATTAAAVVHTHSPEVIALSASRQELPAIHYAITGLGGPVRVAPYRTFGSAALAAAAVGALDRRSAVILRNHGAVTYGADLAQAYGRALLLEWLARTYRMALSYGEPATLSAAELGEVTAELRRRRYGERRALPAGKATARSDFRRYFPERDVARAAPTGLNSPREARGAGVSTSPTASTSSVISYATRSVSHSGAASTARLDPSLMAMTNISPPSISTRAWEGGPASNSRAAPCIKLVSPEVMAASCPAKPAGMCSESASGTPSADTTAACATSATRAVKSVTSQFRSWRYA